ncbi:uncharacterized protein LOC144153500 [Haemaphysalis longicornis]
MSCIGLALSLPFLPEPGRPPIPWTQWHQIFENYLLASGASEFPPERRKALLLHSLGVEGQRVFSSLPLPTDASQTGESTADDKLPEASKAADDKLTEASKAAAVPPSVYDEAVATLTQHFTSSSNVVVERHRFRRRIQHPGESVQEYVAALRALAAACSFASPEDSLRDQFVEAVSSQHIRERLLLEGSTLSFFRAIQLASQIEQASEDLREIASGTVQRISKSSRSTPHDRSRNEHCPRPSRSDTPLLAPRTETRPHPDTHQPASSSA